MAAPAEEAAAATACVEALERWRDAGGDAGGAPAGAGHASPSAGASPVAAAGLELGEEERAWCTRKTLARYSAARGHDPARACASLRETLAWRRTAIVRPLACAPCAADRAAHCFLPLGLTAEGAAVVYICPARAREPGVEETIAHVVSTLEACFTAPRADGTWIVVLDFSGFGLTHAMQVRLGAHFASMFSAHFPETLRFFLLVNTPTIFQMLRAIVEPFADARTMAKVKSVAGAAAEVEAQLVGFGVPARVAKWVRDAGELAPQPGVLPPLPPGAAALAPPGCGREEAAE